MCGHLSVANVRYASDGHAVVRVVADTPPAPDARPVEPTLEDLYLLMFSGNATR